MMSKQKIIFPVLLLISSYSLFADTLHLRPGQCIMVGTQEVCALSVQDPSPNTSSSQKKYSEISICKFGAKEEGTTENPLTGYGHYLIRINEEGNKTETLIKYYDPTKKAHCESDAKGYRK